MGSSVIIAIGQIKKQVKKKVNDICKEAVGRGRRALNEIRTVEIEVLSGQRSGKVYRKPHTRRATYTASAPGEAPARRSGDLKGKWSHRVETAAVGNGIRVTPTMESNMGYSGYLDQGTPRGKIAARPFKQKIEEKALPAVVKIYSEPYH